VVDALGVLCVWRDSPGVRPPGTASGGELALVKGRTFELPAEALRLIEQVRQLEGRAEDARRALGADLGDIRKAATKERAAVEGERAELARDRQALEALLENRVRGFEFIADAWADYERARAKAVASALRRKSHPARSAANEVRAKGREMGDLRRELKRAEWVLRLYEWHFPWLTELRDFEEEQSYVAGEEAMVVVGEDGEPADLAQQWLSQEEYKALPEVKRNQRALDRYLRSRKTPWQLGRDYERYIGYLRERAGARVTYQGIFAGLEDLGRDLLAEHDGVIEIIQCKRWSQHKTIHEKHVFQLFGTVVAARVEYPDRRVTGTFTTTTTLSERAHQFARQLDIRVEESVPLEDYPRIKCNVGRSGERIYHLPFDQQYDTTVISAHRGEAWVSTAAEAEALGFRRAWRWRSAAAATPG
jgi:Restriction endonuclease